MSCPTAETRSAASIGLPDVRRLAVGLLEDLLDEAPRGPDAHVERVVAVGLREDAVAPAQADGVGRVARLRAVRVPPAWRLGLLAEGAGDVAVVVREGPARRLEARGDLRQPPVEEVVRDGRRRVRVQARRVRQAVRHRRAIRRVQVDDDVRVRVADEADERAALGCGELGKVAVEVQPGGVRPLPHARDRPVLERPVVYGDALVAVGVVDRGDHQHEAVGPRRVAAGGEVAEQDQEGFLAIHLSGVDVGEDEDARLARRPDGRGRGIGRAPHDERQGTALARRAEGGPVAARVRRERVEEGEHVGVRACLGEGGALGARERPGRARLGRGAARPGAAGDADEKQGEKSRAHG